MKLNLVRPRERLERKLAGILGEAIKEKCCKKRRKKIGLLSSLISSYTKANGKTRVILPASAKKTEVTNILTRNRKIKLEFSE